MRQFVRSGLVASLLGLFGAVAGAQAPPKAQTKAAPPSGNMAAQAKPARPAILDQVLATVNGEPITRGELYQHLNNYGIPPGAVGDQDLYRVGLEVLTNHKLIRQFVAKQNVPVTEKELDADFERISNELKKDNQDINVNIASAGLTVAQVRDDMKKALGWQKYVKAVATDAALKKFMDEHKDVFNRTQVRASHIVLLVDAKAAPADKEKVRQKLAGIKAEIDGNKISFADAANKFSEDDGNKTSPSGGDLGYFTRRGQFEPSFTAAAFALKKGSVSDPIETPYGYHLIQVTDRKDGTPVDFEQQKSLVQSEYLADLQEKIVAEMRKTAKIDIKPMPADLFPKNPAPTPGPGGTPEPGKAATKAANPGAAVPK